MASKADQKNEARLKREQAQAAAAAKAKRGRNLQVLAAVVFSALVVVVLVVVFSGGKNVPGPGAAEGEGLTGATETTDLLKGLDQNGYSLGDPKAPLTVIEFLDVQCEFCRAHQLDEQPAVIRQLVRPGKAQLRMAPIALPMFGEDSEAGRIVATRLAEQGKAWNFINLWYFNQGKEASGYATDDYLKRLVAAVPGTEPADAAREASPDIAAKLAEVDKLATELKVSGTPTFAVGRTGAALNTYKVVDRATAKSNVDAIMKAVEEFGSKAGS